MLVWGRVLWSFAPVLEESDHEGIQMGSGVSQSLVRAEQSCLPVALPLEQLVSFGCQSSFRFATMKLRSRVRGSGRFHRMAASPRSFKRGHLSSISLRLAERDATLWCPPFPLPSSPPPLPPILPSPPPAPSRVHLGSPQPFLPPTTARLGSTIGLIHRGPLGEPPGGGHHRGAGGPAPHQRRRSLGAGGGLGGLGWGRCWRGEIPAEGRVRGSGHEGCVAAKNLKKT